MRLISSTRNRAEPLRRSAPIHDITPSASRLTTSLRDIGYDPPTAIADLVDNCVDAGAQRVTIRIEFAGTASRIIVGDNGRGMGHEEIGEALRFGSRRIYGDQDLGRFGLGLKTASLSLGRRLTIITRAARPSSPLIARTMDLDHIREHDRWEILEARAPLEFRREMDAAGGHGTIVVIEALDRLLNEARPDSGWSQRRLATFASRTASHLGMVFHRFIEGTAGHRVRMKINGVRIPPWNPFAPDEKHTTVLGEHLFDLQGANGVGTVRLTPAVLPPRSRFSGPEAFERMSGPFKWNRQQGFYVYRENRMIQSGGWSGVRTSDEHTKLARIALHFPSHLDELFQVNVAKMRVTIPTQLRKQLEQVVHEVCQRADTVYRMESSALPQQEPREVPTPRSGEVLREVALALTLAANEVGEFEALERIMRRMARKTPSLAQDMGWG